VDAVIDHLHRCGWSLGVWCYGASWLVELRRGGLHGLAVTQGHADAWRGTLRLADGIENEGQQADGRDASG
jgi:hypothetical protein